MYYFFLLYLSYDGSCFKGINKQKNTSNTIVEHIEKVLNKIFSYLKIKIFSRTDKFVHALEQKIMLKTEKYFDEKTLKKILNSNLKNIYIQKVKIIEKELFFKDVKDRTYIYKFKRNLSVFDYFYYTECKKTRLSLIQENLRMFLGKKDFCFFSKTKIDTIKTIYKIHIKYIDKNEFHVLIKASGFTRCMIRRILSTAISVKKREQRILEKCLMDKKNIYNFFKIKKISPRGLYLKKITFINEYNI